MDIQVIAVVQHRLFSPIDCGHVLRPEPGLLICGDLSRQLSPILSSTDLASWLKAATTWSFIGSQCCYQISVAKVLERYQILKQKQKMAPELFFKMGHSQLLSLYFCLFLLNYNWQIKLCQCWDLKWRSLASEATALPTEPPELLEKKILRSSES